MTAIKSYTDIKQSKKLAEVLPLESADMWYNISIVDKFGIDDYDEYPSFEKTTDIDIPCWSFAGLFGVLPKIGSEEPMLQKIYYANGSTERYICMYSINNVSGEYNNPIDACYEILMRLNELKML